VALGGLDISGFLARISQNGIILIKIKTEKKIFKFTIKKKRHRIKRHVCIRSYQKKEKY